MVEIGGRPILWHIMKHLHHYGVDEFMIALGYRGDMIKRFFLDSANHGGLVSVVRGTPITAGTPEKWTVHLIDTGAHTNTAGRLKRVVRAGFVSDKEPFLVTYGDGLTDLNLNDLFSTHTSEPKTQWATVTAVRPPARFGSLDLNGAAVSAFTEKAFEGWINGGFMIFEKDFTQSPLFEGINDKLDLADVLSILARERRLTAHRHTGFWQCMDTAREKNVLERLWASGAAPWKVWE